MTQRPHGRSAQDDTSVSPQDLLSSPTSEEDGPWKPAREKESAVHQSWRRVCCPSPSLSSALRELPPTRPSSSLPERGGRTLRLAPGLLDTMVPRERQQESSISDPVPSTNARRGGRSSGGRSCSWRARDTSALLLLPRVKSGTHLSDWCRLNFCVRFLTMGT